MVYYLGRDVQVWFLTEQDSWGVDVTSNEATRNSGTLAANFANKLHLDSLGAAYILPDVTSVDVTLGTVDEDVTYYGKRSVLKAEIKKDNTISITRKKDDNVWDVIFNGPTASASAHDSNDLDQGARWGITSASGGGKISNGNFNPKDHLQTGSNTIVEFGYRVVVQLKNSSGTGIAGDEIIAFPNCVITGHTVSLNADGISEETMEFQTHIDPVFSHSQVQMVASTAKSSM